LDLSGSNTSHPYRFSKFGWNHNNPFLKKIYDSETFFPSSSIYIYFACLLVTWFVSINNYTDPIQCFCRTSHNLCEFFFVNIYVNCKSLGLSSLDQPRGPFVLLQYNLRRENSADCGTINPILFSLIYMGGWTFQGLHIKK